MTTTTEIKRIRDLFEYALYKITLYLLTYLLVIFMSLYIAIVQ